MVVNERLVMRGVVLFEGMWSRERGRSEGDIGEGRWMKLLVYY
jgi:hypothetical protein